MKIFDAFRLAAKNLDIKRAAVTAAGAAVCVFCLCFAGAISVHVQQQKDQPCEIDVSAQGTSKISESVLAQAAQIEGVTAVTPLVQIPVTLKAGNYSADLSITGLQRDYINKAFKEGIVFPAHSTMPYIILNEAACKEFSNGETGLAGVKKEPDIRWLSVNFVLETGDGARVSAKVCGILSAETEDEQPLAWMDLRQVQGLLEAGGQPADAAQAKVRAENTGFAESVENALIKLGLSATDTNGEQQGQWDASNKEAVYLIALAMLSLLGTCIYIRTQKKLFFLEEKEPLAMLRRLGVEKREVLHLFLYRTMSIVLCGIAAGLIVALFTPMFILPEDAATSSFALYAPWWVAAVSGGICFLAARLSC